MGDTLAFALVVERKGWRRDRKRTLRGRFVAAVGDSGDAVGGGNDGGAHVGRFMLVLLAERGRRRHEH